LAPPITSSGLRPESVGTRIASVTASSPARSHAPVQIVLLSGLPALPPITPHSLRRTWATFCAMIGRDPKWVAAQIGHVNPKFTFSVYQQVATRRYIDEQAVWTLMRFADEPSERAPTRQITRLQRGDARGPGTVGKGEFNLGIERVSEPEGDQIADE
jgi:hypothetical protein